MSVAQRLRELTHGFDRSAWRWECQGVYASDLPAMRRDQAGDSADSPHRTAWLDHIRAITTAGKTFARVRMLTEPLTDYLAWMIGRTQANVDAGEDIRWLPEAQARELNMPDYDFYLLDDARVAIMRFDTAKVLTDIEVVTDEHTIAQHRSYRDLAWPLAVRHADLAGAAERGT